MNFEHLYTEQSVVDSLYRTYRIVDELLRQHEVRFYMIGGTLLGAVRHGGVIPWDDDGDLAVDERDFPRVRDELLPLLEERGVLSSFGRMGNLKLFAADGRKLRSEGNVGRPRYPIVDLFPFRQVGAVVTFSSPACRERWSAQFFDPSDIAVLADMPFGPLRMPAVAEKAARTYLARTYGEQWETEAEIGYSHLASEKTATTRFQIEDWTSAMPSEVTARDEAGQSPDRQVQVRVREVRAKSAIVSIVDSRRESTPQRDSTVLAVDDAWLRTRLHDIRCGLVSPSELPKTLEVELGDVSAFRLSYIDVNSALADYVDNITKFIKLGNPPTSWFLLNVVPLFPVRTIEATVDEPSLVTLARAMTAEVCSLFTDALALYDIAARQTGWGVVLAWRLRTRLGLDPADVIESDLSQPQVTALREERTLGTADAAAVTGQVGPPRVRLATSALIAEAYAAASPDEMAKRLAVPAALGCDEAQMRLARLLTTDGQSGAASYWMYESARSGNPNAIHEWTRRLNRDMAPVSENVLDLGARCGDVTARILLEGRRGGDTFVLDDKSSTISSCDRRADGRL